MSILPSDILRLLPQWMDVDTYLQLPLVSKTYRKLFPIPKTVDAVVERWIHLEISRITVCINGTATPSAVIPDKVLECLDAFKNEGYIVHREELLRANSYELRLPITEVLDKYREITDWGVGHPKAQLPEEWEGWTVAANDAIRICSWPNDDSTSSSILEIKVSP